MRSQEKEIQAQICRQQGGHFPTMSHGSMLGLGRALWQLMRTMYG